MGTVLIVGMQAMSGLGTQFAAQLALVAASLCYGAAALFGRNFTSLDPVMPAAGRRAADAGAALSHRRGAVAAL